MVDMILFIVVNFYYIANATLSVFFRDLGKISSRCLKFLLIVSPMYKERFISPPTYLLP